MVIYTRSEKEVYGRENGRRMKRQDCLRYYNLVKSFICKDLPRNRRFSNFEISEMIFKADKGDIHPSVINEIAHHLHGRTLKDEGAVIKDALPSGGLEGRLLVDKVGKRVYWTFHG